MGNSICRMRTSKNIRKCLSVIYVNACLCASYDSIIFLSTVVVTEFIGKKPMDRTEFQSFTSLDCQNTNGPICFKCRIVIGFLGLSGPYDLHHIFQDRVLSKMFEYDFAVIRPCHDHTNTVALLN